MRIISCYIRAFGGIRDMSFDFTDGLNTILWENGAGKTTLLTFIKSMFYGMDYKQGASKFYERTHFLPWDSDTCGGSLVFENEDGRYRIDRSFGKKKNDDTYTLFDENTKSESQDYDENIGERLFGVDKASFEKSIYFGQGSLETSITTSLNAKMGNISDVRDDMNRFDEAIKSIDDARADYERKTTKNPGKIFLIDKEIKACMEALERIPVLEGAVSDRRNSIEEKNESLEALSKEKEELSERIKSAGRQKEQQGIISAKKEQALKLKEEIQEKEDFFQGRIPEKDEIESMQTLQRDLVAGESRLSEINDRIPDEDRASFLTSVFGVENAITGQIIEQSTQESTQIAALRASAENTGFSEESQKALEECSVFFEKRLPTSEEIDEYRQDADRITAAEASLKVLTDSREAMEASMAKTGGGKNKLFIALIFVGVLIGLIGLLTSFAEPPVSTYGPPVGFVIGGIVTVVSVILLIQTNVSKGLHRKQNEERYRSVSQEIESNLSQSSMLKGKCLSFIGMFMETTEDEDIQGDLIDIQRKLDEYQRLLELQENFKKETAESTDALAELQMNLYSRLSGPAEIYGYDLFSTHKEAELLSKLSEDIKEYDRYLEDVAQVKQISDENSQISEKLEDFISRYTWDEEKGTEHRLTSLIGMLESYITAKESLEELEAEILSFQEENPHLEEESLETLQEKSREIEEKYEPLLQARVQEEEALAGILEDIDESEEMARGILALKERRAEMVKRVEVLVDTKKYLEQARDDFLSVYMKPLRDSMEKYTGMFLPSGMPDGAELTLDMDLSVRIFRRGTYYTGEHLSEGYGDLAFFCARLALMDILYKNGIPFFLMDDPFTNLDEDKIQKALCILEELSKDTQIIYLTCHGSRAKGKSIS